MSFTNAAKDAAANSLRALLTSNIGYLSAHTADPGTTGANEVSGDTRGSSTFPAASGGTGSTGGQASITVPSAGSTTTVTHVGLWTASTGGTYITSFALSPTETYSTAGGVLKYTPTLNATG